MTRALAVLLILSTAAFAAVGTALVLAQQRAPVSRQGATTPSQRETVNPGMPSQLPTPHNDDPSTCPETLAHFTTIDGPEPTLENLAAMSSAVAVGTIRSIDATRFNTSKGQRPDAGATFATSVVTPVVVDVTQVVGDKLELGETSVLLPGGAIGCETWHVSGLPRMRIGEEFLLFLEQRTDFSGAQLEALTIRQALIVTARNVSTPSDGIVRLEEAIALIGAR